MLSIVIDAVNILIIYYLICLSSFSTSIFSGVSKCVMALLPAAYRLIPGPSPLGEGCL